MKFLRNSLFILLALYSVTACKKSPLLYPVGDTPVDDPGNTVRIQEGTMLLRGIDQLRIDGAKIPNPFSDFVFVVMPGKRTLLTKNIQTGIVYSPENLRCYRLTAELLPGVDYVLDEDRDRHLALLKRADTKDVVATGNKVDEKAAYTKECNWQRM